MIVSFFTSQFSRNFCDIFDVGPSVWWCLCKRSFRSKIQRFFHVLRSLYDLVHFRLWFFLSFGMYLLLEIEQERSGVSSRVQFLKSYSNFLVTSVFDHRITECICRMYHIIAFDISTFWYLWNEIGEYYGCIIFTICILLYEYHLFTTAFFHAHRWLADYTEPCSGHQLQNN